MRYNEDVYAQAITCNCEPIIAQLEEIHAKDTMKGLKMMIGLFVQVWLENEEDVETPPELEILLESYTLLQAAYGTSFDEDID